MKNFAIIGVGGYIAPRHLQAIKQTGNELVAALDVSDSVGVLDQYFGDVDFFTEFERFDRHLEKTRREDPKKAVQYVSICSPNYLHDAHIRFALRHGADAICEKPLVLNPWNLDHLQELEKELGHRIWTILQLRLHPSIIELKKTVDAAKQKEKYDIDLSYITPRGNWYLFSWKGDNTKSGGVATNIGIHFFDMLLWIFGDVISSDVHLRSNTKMAGYLELEHARVRWFLSVDKNDLLEEKRLARQPFRSITIDGKELEFSTGFTDLHTIVYQNILDGKGHGIDDARPSIILAHNIRNVACTVTKREQIHPMAKEHV